MDANSIVNRALLASAIMARSREYVKSLIDNALAEDLKIRNSELSADRLMQECVSYRQTLQYPYDVLFDKLAHNLRMHTAHFEVEVDFCKITYNYKYYGIRPGRIKYRNFKLDFVHFPKMIIIKNGKYNHSISHEGEKWLDNWINYTFEIIEI